MKKMVRYTLLVVLLSLASRNSFSQVKESYTLSPLGSISAKIPSEVFLGNPKNVQISKDGTILWGEKDKALFLKKNKTGMRTIKTFSSKGRGPGETLSATYYQFFDSGRVATLDRSQAKITVFDSTHSHLYDIPIRNVHENQFLALRDGLFATFNSPIYKKENHAISVYKKDGKLKNQWGTIPYYAMLQAYRNGGGITKDNKGNIYYSYLGGYKIWKINAKTGKGLVFNKKPDYFDGISDEQITALHDNLNKLIRYSFKITRVSGLFFLKPDLIIQQMDDGNPWNGEDVQTHLEIWNTKGEKLGSVKVPHWVAGVKGRQIYIYADTPTKLIKKSDHQSTIRLFDVFKLKQVNK